MIQRPPTRLIALGAGVVVLALIVAGWTFLTDEGAPAEPIEDWTYVTAPEATPPVIDVSRYDIAGEQPETDDGFIFIAPKDGETMTGPLIVNADGAPVWIGPDVRAYDFRVQHYQGEPVLTYWRGDTIVPYYGVGEFVLLNEQYEEVATVSTHGIPQAADYHEMTLTDEGTALLIGHRLVQRDLSFKSGGTRRSWVADGIVQEVDVATGKVLFEWHTLGHIPINQSMTGLRAYGSGTRGDPYDYAHVNSVTEDGDDAFLISARNTSAVYRVDRKTGEVDWTLGGKASDFTMAPDTRFYWQHDAQRQDDGTITLFDNEGAPPKAKRSRGLRLALDMKARTARIVTQYLPPDDRLSGSQGNVQVMPNGHVFVGWGSQHYYSEYTADGELLLDADFSTGESYRSYRSPWVGRPSDPPTLVVDDGTAYVSWNGATEVASWRFLAGDDADSARDVGTVRREGFETSAEIPNAPYVAVQALDADGNVLATVER